MKKLLSAIFLFSSVLTMAQEKVYAPSLVAPSNGAVNQYVVGLSDWNPVAGAATYQVQIDTSSSFTNPVSAFSSYSAWTYTPLLFGTTYYWRVRAIGISAGDTSAWSTVWSFTVVDKPTLNTPFDNSVVVPVSPTMKWNAIPGITKYQAQFDSVNTFNSGFLKTQVVDAYEFSTRDNQYGNEYFWRVRGINGTDTSDWSLTRTFTTRDSIALTSPSNGNTGIHPIDSIKFKSVFGTTGYLFAFDDDPAFSTPYYFTWDSSAIRIFSGDTTARGAMDTIAFGSFYWKVCLFNHVDTSKWSEVRTLTTVAKVTMTSPADDDTLVPVTTSFTWDAIRGAKYYILEYDTNASYSNPTKVNVTGVTYTPANDLLSRTDYYWRVRCVTASDTTSVWDEYYFKTYFGVGFEENNTPSWSVYPNPTTGPISLTIESANNARMEILNVLGDVVYSRNGLVNGVNVINLSSLADGVYMLRLYIDGQMTTSRIVKK